MKRLLLSGLAVLSVLAGADAQPNFVVNPAQTISNTNNGVVTVPPQIDAINVINYGTFQIVTVGPSTPAPFETFNTLNYTNYGTMLGINGYRFSFNSTTNAKRAMASSFVNLNSAVVEAIDPPALGLNVGGLCAVSAIDPSYLLISATNIVNGGGITTGGSSLIVGANGLLDIDGQNVDLSHSGVMVRPIQGIGEVLSIPPTNFIPDVAIYDRYWVQTNFTQANPLFQGNLWDGFTARAQGVPSPPTQPQGTPAQPFLLGNPVADSYINFGDFLPVSVTNDQGVVSILILRSNVFKGAFFVSAPPGFNLSGGFFVPAGRPANNLFETAEVLVTVDLPNDVTGVPEQHGFYIADGLASQPNLRGVAENVLFCASPATFRPQNYFVDRLLFIVGAPNNQYPDPDFFVNSGNFDPVILTDSVTNFVVEAGAFAGYGMSLNNLASQLPSLAGATISNAPGRVVINAKNLDLEETRIRGEGLVKIKARNLTSSTNTIIDAENLSFDLDSQSGNLKVENLSKDTVQRLKGNINAWSATWSNTVQIEIENFAPDTNVPPVYVQSNIVINLNVNWHAFMVDATALGTAAPVSVYDLRTHTADTTLNDTMRVVENLLIEGKSLTINGILSIPGVYPNNLVATPLRNFIASNAPNLLYFTNNGTFTIVNEAHFGDDRPPYSRFINAGTINGAGIAVKSDFLENRGSLNAQGGLFVQGGIGKLDGGSSSSGTVTDIRIRELKFNDYELDSVGKLFLAVTTSLSDAGPGSDTVFNLSDSFNLTIKPVLGDLLGTTIQSSAPGNSKVNHTWAGEDRGPSAAGFSNNVAIGTLVLLPGTSSAKFTFAGTGAHNGIYADRLDLSAFTSATALSNQIQIFSNIKLYFASARLGFTPPNNTNGFPQQPEEYLNGLFGGHLQWVSSFAGPNSSQIVLVDGVSIPVNKALFNSQIIDSDGDTIPNAQDGAPNINDPTGNVFQLAPILVEVNGDGTVTPGVGELTSFINDVTALTAIPGEGAVFTGWSGSIESPSPVIVFTNTGGLNFVANFEFQVLPGTYNGLFYQSDGVVLGQSGLFTVRTTKSGSYSGSVQIGRDKFPFSGEVDDSGHTVPDGDLDMDLQFGHDHVTGTIGDGGIWTADLVADRAVFNSKTNPAPYAGRYTIAFPGSGAPTNDLVPLGNGYGTVTVDSAGRVKLSGSLADGTKVSQTSTVSGEGTWPLYVPLYNGEGQLLGWMSFVPTGEGDVGGLFSWIKSDDVTAKFYPDGFTLVTNAVGSVYVPTNSPVSDFTSGQVVLTGGNLTNDITNDISIANNNKVANLSTNKLTMSINASQGVFKGSAVNPATGKPVKFSGVFLQRQNIGTGFFLGTNQSGKVTVSP